jgi:hypothetical protein
MERSLIKEVNIKGMTARFNTKNVIPLVFPNFFGIKKTDKLTWENLTGTAGVPVMADVISYDSKAPIKTRETVGKLSGDIPKIAIKRGMIESEWVKYQSLAADVSGQADLKALLDFVFEDFDFCYNGVRSRMEWLAMQAVSKGSISLVTTNNNGIVTEEAVDFGVPAGNKTGVAIDWASHATAVPLDNIEEWNEAIYAASGRSMRYIVMRKGDFNDLKACTDTTTKISAWVNSNGKLLVTKDTINEYLTANDLPNIVVVKSSVRFENGEHTRSIVNPWENHRVLFCEDLKIGNIQHGPIPAESNAEVKKIATLAKKDFALITKWAELEPFAEWTKAEANAFPVLDDPASLYYMDVEHTAWGADA